MLDSPCLTHDAFSTPPVASIAPTREMLFAFAEEELTYHQKTETKGETVKRKRVKK